MMKKISAHLAFGLALVIALNAYAVEKSSQTVIVNNHRVFDGGSRETAAVIQWLQQRKGEEQNSSMLDIAVSKQAIVTVDIHAEMTGSGGDHGSAANTTGPGGIGLPSTGTPGQQITIKSCTPGASSQTQTFTWTVTRDGVGYWLGGDLFSQTGAGVTCDGSHGNQPGMQ